MKLGIDFGTTRIVVASVDRGNYPLVPFESAEGTYDWFPPLVAIRATTPLWMGSLERAERNRVDHHPVAQTIARRFRTRNPYRRRSRPDPITDLLLGLTSALRRDLAAHFGEKEPLEVMLGVPANANSNQRFLTVDAFRRAGFEVLGLLNEPSAASIEFGHRNKSSGNILIYDLGGGTFDASLVEVEVAHTPSSLPLEFRTSEAMISISCWRN